MSRLESIEIKHVKGIGDKKFELNLFPNKPSLLVAPNGFGKSSIACALYSMNNARIDLEDKHYPNGDKANSPTITISFDGVPYTATSNKNDISSQFDICVINNSVVAKAVKRNMGKFSAVSVSLEVPSVTLVDTIPPKVGFDYSISVAKANFGPAGKVLPNLSALLDDLEFLRWIDRDIDMSVFSKVRTFIKPLGEVVSEINKQTGPAEKIKDWVKTQAIGNFESIAPLKVMADSIRKKQNQQIVDAYLLALQLAELSQGASFKPALAYHVYLREKEIFDQLFASFNTTRHTIKCIEKKNGNKKSLVIEFPKADDVSNGQRDILNFIVQLQRAKRKFRKQNCILVIDEIFDYLDDANLVAFQYYITKSIEEFKKQEKNIYPILLTHLDPAYFRHFCFNKHKLQIRYLNKDNSLSESIFLKLVKRRDDASIKDEVSKHHFHYHHDEIDMESQFQALSLRKAWGKPLSFYDAINKETDKYLKEQIYDSIAVLLSVRIEIERQALNNLPTDKHEEFYGVFGTKKKLEFCVEHGVDVPETHFLLGIIYNDDLHWHDNKDYETPLRSKLQNVTIKKLITELFES